MAQTYILQRLDELKTISLETAAKADEMLAHLRALPAMETTESSFISRLGSLVPLLQALSVMLTKHLTTVLVVWYMARGGDPLKGAELLLKLL